MKAKSIGCNFVNFDDGTCWPRMHPCGDHGDTPSHRLRYCTYDLDAKTVEVSRSDTLVAASVMDAYTSILLKPHRRLLEVVEALRKVEVDIANGDAICRQCRRVTP